MASPGLLLLLLMSSSLLISSLSAASSSNQQKLNHLQKRGKVKERIFTAAAYFDKIESVVSPFIELIPFAGPVISIAFKTIISLMGKVQQDFNQELFKKDLMSQFQDLNDKIEKYHIEQKWDAWAPTYAEYETKILVAWKKFKQLLEAFANPSITRDDIKKNLEKFKKEYEKPPIDELYVSLTKTGTSFSTNFGNLLAKTVRCHEKNIKEFTLYLIKLFYMGNTVTYFYSCLNNFTTSDTLNDLAETAYKAASLMFDIHRKCISEAVNYIRADVKDRIDANKDRQILAKEIRMFLEKTYDRYNWIVVAYITKNSGHKNIESMNKHFLSGFLETVTRGDISVAVARQVKGTHTKADKVRKAIEKCFAESPPECQHVIEKLNNCEEQVDKDVMLKKTYSAVHAFISKSHESIDAKDAKEAPEDEYIDSESQSETPYMYIGKCKKYKIFKGGKFRVLIKSDEEIMEKSPCDKLHCGGEEKGKCVLLDNNLIPVCECTKEHYGENCEESLEDYKKAIKE